MRDFEMANLIELQNARAQLSHIMQYQDNRCVSCGAVIPEGVQVCLKCGG